jgi:hypothetical protein
MGALRTCSWALGRRIKWTSVILLLSVGAGCESSDEGGDAAVDATTDVDGNVDAGPSCREPTDGGAVWELLANPDGGVEDGGDAWYDQETCQPWEDGCPTGDGRCLTAADDCSVFHGTIGDLVCVLRGFEGGNPPWPPPSAEVDGSCLTRRESASVPIGDCCDGHNWFYDLYELTEAGECKLEVRRSSSEGDILHVHFDIHFVVTPP